MKLTFGPGRKASFHFGGIGVLLTLGAVAVGVAAALNARDIQRYMRIRSM